METHVDPLRLIMAYSKENKKNVDYVQLKKVAASLPFDSDDNPYDFRQFFSNVYNI